MLRKFVKLSILCENLSSVPRLWGLEELLAREGACAFPRVSARGQIEERMDMGCFRCLWRAAWVIALAKNLELKILKKQTIHIFTPFIFIFLTFKLDIN